MLGVLVASLVVVFASPSWASPVTGTITGDVTADTGAFPGVAVGSTISGSYSYDNSSIASTPFGAGNPLTAFSLTIGSNPFVFNLGSLNTTIGADKIIGDSTSTDDSLFFIFTSAAITAFGGGTLINDGGSTMLPESFNLNTSLGDFSAAFTATPAAASVPEPASIALVGLALTMALVATYRRRKLLSTDRNLGLVSHSGDVMNWYPLNSSLGMNPR